MVEIWGRRLCSKVSVAEWRPEGSGLVQVTGVTLVMLCWGPVETEVHLHCDLS